MTIRLRHILLVTIAITAAHLAAVTMGWYEKTVWAVDGPLHFLGGALAAMVFLWFTEKNVKEQKGSRWYIFFAILGAALVGSFLWELIEFLMLRSVPTFAIQYKLYSTTPGDLLSDLGFGLAGGLFLASVLIQKTLSIEK